MSLTDQQLKTFGEAIGAINFKEPGAHKLYRELHTEAEKLLTTKATWREFYFYKLGVYLTTGQIEFDTNPPLSVVPKTTMEAKE